MSRPANPWDNAACESFMSTLKQEEIYCQQYRDLEDLSLHIDDFIGNYYNRLRLHSALGYQSPEQFEKANPELSSPQALNAAKMQYFQNTAPPATTSRSENAAE
jgi:transposase InsO family protein